MAGGLVVAGRVGSANSGGLVFVDESAEQIAAAKVGRRCQRRRIAPVEYTALVSVKVDLESGAVLPFAFAPLARRTNRRPRSA